MRRAITYEDIRRRPDDVWLFQYRPITWVDVIICKATMAAHCHSALVFKHEGRLVHFETHPKRGVNLVSLTDIIHKHHDKVDVYRIDHWCRHLVCVEKLKAALLPMLGNSYGWKAISKIVLANTPVFWQVIPLSVADKKKTKQLPTCSQLVAYGFRSAGLDVVPRTPDWMVVPGDLTKSLAFRYEGVLISTAMSECLHDQVESRNVPAQGE